MALFPLGRLVATPGALDALTQEQILTVLRRHANGDWGDMDAEDTASNNRALANGDERIFSSYQLTPTLKVWVITEWDRSVTTVLLPSEY